MKIKKQKENKTKNEKLKKHINININFTIVAIVLIAIFCICVTPITLQNDTYYTIKIGELIKNNGIDMMDHFSWHENLSYTYPHWLYDLCTYFIYAIGGFKGIYIITCALSVILGISIFLVNSKLTKNKSISFIITIGAIYVLKPYCSKSTISNIHIVYMGNIFYRKIYRKQKNRLWNRTYNYISINCKLACCNMAILLCTIFAIYSRIFNIINIRHNYL